MKIYLADLVYDTVETNYAIPLNIGFIAAYLKEQFKEKVEIKLFKYPKKLEKAINDSPPDILGLSHYGWNERLNKIFFNLSKKMNPNVTNVIGGPNMRHTNESIEKFLLTNKNIDYCIMFEGEESFSALVNNIINKISQVPIGCASLVNNKLSYEPSLFKKKSSVLDLPSPYLTGMLDEFLVQENIIPLFESNRGCPYGCTYCAWGVSALSKIRKRPLPVILEELEYVAKHSVGQHTWIFTDANFGMFERDVDIAKAIRSIKEKYSYPHNVIIWHSKNTSDRNIEISKILDDVEGYIAIQSSDSKVLKNAGRGNIQFKHLQKQIEYYKEHNLSVLTDILIGLPGETKESHFQTLSDAFTLGFDNIQIYNIRMLQGTDYDSLEHRTKYEIITKYRPIFGGYGKYDGKIVFELEESIRGTKDMKEEDLEMFKLLHWLLYFTWNAKVFKPLLNYALKNNISPIKILSELLESQNSILQDVFTKMKNESLSEWFDTKEEMIKYYEVESNYTKLVSSFTKLTFSWVAKFFQNKDLLSVLNKELQKIIENQFTKGMEIGIWDEVIQINDLLIIDNFFEEPFQTALTVSEKSLGYVLNDYKYTSSRLIDILIYRPTEDKVFCTKGLTKNNKKDLSIQSLTSFLEIGGMNYLKNKIKLL